MSNLTQTIIGSAVIWSAPEDTTPPARLRIDALQGLLAIDQAGLVGAYTAWATSPDRTFAQKAFIDKAQIWRRDDPTLSAAASDLGLSAGQVDALFALAATL